ncbi:MAG TPA: hypothetical protein VGH39_10805 [Xanthobacteraceae bacterium]
MTTAFDRDQLLAAFDEIGSAAISASAHLDIAVFGGSALMLASNFRFSTEDVDISEIGRPWPAWLSAVVESIAARNGWPPDWLNEAVTFHLSPLANPARDLVVLGTFPRGSERVGLTVFVPSARYMLALKLKALRVAEFDSGSRDLADTAALLRVLQINQPEDAIAILAEYFPNSALHADKQRFVLKRLLSEEGPLDAPIYPGRSL